MTQLKKGPMREATRTGRKLSKPPFHTSSISGAFGHYALELADQGFAVLPVGSNKSPLTEHGHLSASTDHAKIEEWARRFPSANLGVACGEVSRNLVVADIDRPGQAILPGAGRLRLPAAPQYRTSRGRHVWTYSEGPLTTSTLPWGELKATGYVVAPPSIHPSGETYEWLVPLDFGGLIPVGELAHFLPGISEALGGATKTERPMTPKDNALSLGITEALRADDWTAVGFSVELAEAFSSAFDLPQVGKKFKCLLPGCGGRPHAALWVSPQGVKYRCFSGQSGNAAVYAIAGVYAAVKTGRTRELTPAELAFWTRKALADFGLVERPRVDLPALPEGMSASRYRLREAVQEIFQVWAIGSETQPRPCATDFLVPLSGLSRATVLRAKGDLLTSGVIERAGHYRGAFGKGTLYLPGQTNNNIRGIDGGRENVDAGCVCSS